MHTPSKCMYTSYWIVSFFLNCHQHIHTKVRNIVITQECDHFLLQSRWRCRPGSNGCLVSWAESSGWGWNEQHHCIWVWMSPPVHSQMAIFRHMLGYNDNYTRTVGLIRGFGQLHSCWGAPLLSLQLFRSLCGASASAHKCVLESCDR